MPKTIVYYDPTKQYQNVNRPGVIYVGLLGIRHGDNYLNPGEPKSFRVFGTYTNETSGGFDTPDGLPHISDVTFFTIEQAMEKFEFIERKTVEKKPRSANDSSRIHYGKESIDKQV